ncbi:AhpC/TSA family protein [Mucilaginibacter terrigena]|uniref:AhpC/TSA family protein n=1 Tax=Mucilaginibacter terrigena TaxID=2492395 RepID=A0A4Q5LRC3_9SPHI|nr:TlpA disulfide reductase family protein [Mucilaginibacter terrigena]RYU92032.1 AhpC/TSA family protein [Mucilaginibacter terrigena]
MKYRFFTGIALVAALSITSCKQTNSFTISGKLENPGGLKKVYLLAADSVQVNIIDSTTLGSDNGFKFKHNTPYANLYKLRIAGNVYDLVAKNGDAISFKTDVADVNHAYEVGGSETSEKIKEFNSIANIYGEKSSKLSDEYTTKAAALGKESDSLLKIYIPQFQKNMEDYSAAVLKFANDNKKSLAGFYAATSLDQNKYEQQLVAYADDIKDDFKDNPSAQTFVRQMEAIKPVSIGHKAPEFTMATIDGKQVKLSDYKGKYLLLDFWASWCAPCRRENPNVVKQYGIYKNKGFNILGVSLDVDKNAWKKAVNADGLTWTHASELQTFEGPTERLYHIQAIPSNFILDPQGVIVAKNVTGADLEAFLKKTFK